MNVGVTGFGAYVPRSRVRRQEIVDSHRWLSSGATSLAQSERSATGFDEDSVTMAVEAARDCLAGADRSKIDALYLASTTVPFADRLNAGIVSGALGLSDATRAQDTTGSLRAGTTALLAAFDAVGAQGIGAMCVASDSRNAAIGTVQELTTGHAAAALLVGPGPGLARLLGSASVTIDFVDHYRAVDSPFDYYWEERWVREEGYLKLVPELVSRVLYEAEVKIEEVDHFCLPVSLAKIDKAIAKLVGLPEDRLSDNLFMGCGDAGAAHSLLMFAHALETARPGEKILVIGFGQGGDALLFEVTEEIVAYQEIGTGVSKWIRRGAPLEYFRFLAIHGMMKIDWGMRSETDKPTSQTAAYRHRDFLLSFVGGRCSTCGTRQIPRSSICVNPECRANDTQVPESFAETTGRIISWSADNLTFTPDPPAYYGMVDFDGGGRLLMDITNVENGGVEVGLPVRMVFRIKDHDKLRGFTRYFWKAAPLGPKEG